MNATEHTYVRKRIESSEHLISMTPYDGIVELGHALTMNESTRILDLCCGYGEMLRIFAVEYGAMGTGVDICENFISAGTARMHESGVSDRVTLVQADARTWNEDGYDIACLIGERIFGGFEDSLDVLMKKIVPGGCVVIGTPYYLKDHVPQELIDYEGALETEKQIFEIIERRRCIVTCIERDTRAEWDRYIGWSARRGLARYRNETSPEKKDELLAGLNRWYRMYNDYRKELQGWAIYAIEQV